MLMGQDVQGFRGVEGHGVPSETTMTVTAFGRTQLPEKSECLVSVAARCEPRPAALRR